MKLTLEMTIINFIMRPTLVKYLTNSGQVMELMRI